MNAGSKLSLREVIKSAWHNLKGTKWAIWGPQLTLFLIYAGLGGLFMLLTSLFGFLPQPGMMLAGGFFIGILIFEVVVIFLITPLVAGMEMTALKRMRGESISASSGFQYWQKWMPLGFTVLLFVIGNFIINQVLNFLIRHSIGTPVLSSILLILLVIFSVLYVTFFVFNVLAVADKDRGPFQALGYSAKIVAPHWFRVLLMLCWIVIVTVIMALPAVLGMLCPVNWVKVLGVLASLVLLIWALPYWYLLLSGTYNKLAHD